MKPIAAVFDSKPFRDTGTQCKSTPPSQISLWASSDIDRHLRNKIITGVLKPMSQSHSDLSLSASAFETNTVSVNVKDLQINNISLNGAAEKGAISLKSKLQKKDDFIMQKTKKIKQKNDVFIEKKVILTV